MYEDIFPFGYYTYVDLSDYDIYNTWIMINISIWIFNLKWSSLILYIYWHMYYKGNIDLDL